MKVPQELTPVESPEFLDLGIDSQGDMLIEKIEKLQKSLLNESIASVLRELFRLKEGYSLSK
jgi:hypothetical protein